LHIHGTDLNGNVHHIFVGDKGSILNFFLVLIQPIGKRNDDDRSERERKKRIRGHDKAIQGKARQGITTADMIEYRITVTVARLTVNVLIVTIIDKAFVGHCRRRQEDGSRRDRSHPHYGVVQSAGDGAHCLSLLIYYMVCCLLIWLSISTTKTTR
jgi:hypothetical protein